MLDSHLDANSHSEPIDGQEQNIYIYIYIYICPINLQTTSRNISVVIECIIHEFSGVPITEQEGFTIHWKKGQVTHSFSTHFAKTLFISHLEVRRAIALPTSWIQRSSVSCLLLITVTILAPKNYLYAKAVRWALSCALQVGSGARRA